MKKLLAMLIAGAFATVAFANDASAPMNVGSKEEGKTPASAEKNSAKKHHKSNKKHHGKKVASAA